MMKKVHIFHISEFGGHSKAAQNIKEALIYKNPQIDVLRLNGLGYFYPRAEKVIDFLYTKIIKYAPYLWGKAYDRKKVATAVGPSRMIVNRFTFNKLRRFIKEYKPDCFVATQAFPCGAIADFKERTGATIPLIAVVTDYHPNRFWFHPCVDRYVVACKEAKEVLIKEGIDPDKIKILGIPISVKFLTTYPKNEVSQEFGFNPELDSVLIMGGGLGLGPIKTIAQKLDELHFDFQMIVVCGKNKGLFDWFKKNKDKFSKPIFVFGYIEGIHKIMDFSDIIITKAGGITVSESLAKGLCIIVTNPIPGQEERNVDYLLKRKAIAAVDGANQVVEVAGKLLGDKKEMYALATRAKENSFIDSSLRIVDLIFELVS